MKLKPRFGMIISLAILGLGAAGCGLLLLLVMQPAPPRDRTQLPSFGKSRTSGTHSVAALGRLTPQGEIIEIGGLMGDRLHKLVAEQGIWFQQGAILGYLDSHDERKAERDAIATQLTEARSRLAAELTFLDAQIKEALVGVRQARELAPLDIAAQKAKTHLLETELATARADLERMQSLTTPGAISAQKLGQQLQLVSRYRQELEAAEAMLAKSAAAKLLNLQRAQAVLEAARAARKKAEATSGIDALVKNLALAEVRLQRTVLRAPRAGEILRIMSRPGERVDQKPILKMGDTRNMLAIAEVYETDIILVKLGQRARITSSALPDALTGTVEKIGRMIYKNDIHHIDPAASADARVIEVTIRLDPSELAGRMTNLQVDVVISE
ncbi:MAG: HlyD family efflux transporter periplasmic adaptor subunit [Planctomycetes bacterium]|nr:HlyD family efflux transporter periplasmic adaptor subunit [Planctomycetota bacterium]